MAANDESHNGSATGDVYRQTDNLPDSTIETKSMLAIDDDAEDETSGHARNQKTVEAAQINGNTSHMTDEAYPADDDGWKMDVKLFSSSHMKRQKQPGDKKHPRKLRKFYKAQDKLIEEFELAYNTTDENDDSDGRNDARNRKERIAGICAKVSFFANLLLFIGKMVATVLSGSLSIMSSVVDSAVDLISGVVMWYTSSAMKKRDYFKYPEGKKRMEPLSILVLSVVMSMASAMVILKSAEQIESYISSENAKGPVLDAVSISLICITIVVKFILFLSMFRVRVPSVAVLSQDHRNDTISNIVALIMGFIGYKHWVFADPIGAIAIAVYILAGWCVTAYEQVMMLTGKTAAPDFLKKLTWITMNHHQSIEAVDTICAYHFGVNFLAEIHIVLPATMNVREAHDIQESLQSRLEEIEEVERAFVHIDYETTHRAYEEHKLV